MADSRFTALSLLLPIFIVGCEGASMPDTASVRDSAGVTVVESFAPRWGQGAGWTVGPELLLEIGEASGDPAKEFYEIAAVVRDPRGRIVVADGGAGEIRAFDEDGSHLWTAGRLGEGPGEYRIITNMEAGSDGGLRIYDYSLQRITTLSPDGDLGEVVTMDHEIPTLGMVGRRGDGSFVLAQLWGSARTEETMREGLRRDPIIVAHFGATGELIDTIGEFPGREILVRLESGRGVMGSPLFGRQASHTLWNDVLVVGDQTTFELGLYSMEGDLRRIIRIPDTDLAITREEIEALMEEQMERLREGERARYRSFLEEAGIPETRPAYAYLLPDAEGNLWVSEYARYPTPPTDWTVLDAEGRWLGTVSMPEGFQPHQIGSDWIVGTAVSELDVPSVRMYPLVK